MNNTLYWILLTSVFVFGWGASHLNWPAALPQAQTQEAEG